MENLEVKIFDKNSGEVLFQCSMEEVDKAYEFASQMEELGFEVNVHLPTILESLSNCLGLNETEQEHLFSSAEEEIEDHDASCCITKSPH